MTNIRTIVLNSFTFLCFVAVKVFFGLLFDLCVTMISYGLLSWFFGSGPGCSGVPGSLNKPFLLAHVTPRRKKSSNNNFVREARESVRLFVVPIT